MTASTCTLTVRACWSICSLNMSICSTLSLTRAFRCAVEISSDPRTHELLNPHVWLSIENQILLLDRTRYHEPHIKAPRLRYQCMVGRELRCSKRNFEKQQYTHKLPSKAPEEHDTTRHETSTRHDTSHETTRHTTRHDT